MADIQKVRLPSGREVFVEVSDEPGRAGLEPVSRPGERASELATETFGQALGTIEEVAEQIHAALSRMVEKPRQVSVELGVKFTVSGGVIIAQGGAEANLKLTLGWTNETQRPPREDPGEPGA
jgi:hypothetical protein